MDENQFFHHSRNKTLFFLPGTLLKAVTLINWTKVYSDLFQGPGLQIEVCHKQDKSFLKPCF